MESGRAEPEPREGEEAAGGAEALSFWRRMFGGGEGRPEDAGATDAEESEVEESGVMRRNVPRRPQRTVFEEAEAERLRRRAARDEDGEKKRKRYANAAMLRRERLARAIGQKVEQVIDHRMEQGEEQLERVAGGFQEVRSLLGAIGRNLDDQASRSERVAQVMELLPAASERELETLEQIARAVEGQSGTTRSVAESLQEVPQALALVRQANQAASDRLLAIREVRQELELQRDQREALMLALRESSVRFEEGLGRLQEAIVASAAQARTDAQALKSSLELQLRGLVEHQREEGKRGDQRTARLEDGLHELSRRMCENNALAGAAVARQGEAIESYRDAHEDLVDALTRAQSRTIQEMRRMQEEVQERADELAQRGRMTLVGAAGALALLLVIGAFFLGRTDPTPAAAPEQTATTAEETESTTTLPAGFRRTGEGE